ncbi:methyltransferase domain-containing protein [candidate division KSB1 bacterium]|nr:methyltransferase domain-containing protein [candidate division KSB1 bacterium]
MNKKIDRIFEFYKKEKALVTSPFIEIGGKLNDGLLSAVFTALGIETRAKIVVDIGCGTGALARYFNHFSFYVGMDLVKHPSLSGSIDNMHVYSQGDAQQLPFARESADLVVCLDSFEHYPDQLRAAKQFYDIMKKGGVLFLSVPNYANVAGWVKKRLEKSGRYEPDSWAPFDSWKPEELEQFVTPALVKKVFSRAGFSRFQYIGYRAEVAVGLFPWIWHPKMPGKLERLIRMIFKPFSGMIVNLWPDCSLHTFWKIVK